jgi:hypothetical protein
MTRLCCENVLRTERDLSLIINRDSDKIPVYIGTVKWEV